MHISSWAAMTKRHRGRKWHCRTIRTFNLLYARLPQATQWPDGRNKHTRQWLGYDNSIPRYVFPLSKTWLALTGGLKTSRDMKKDFGKPGSPNDHRSQARPFTMKCSNERDFRWHFSGMATRTRDVRCWGNR